MARRRKPRWAKNAISPSKLPSFARYGSERADYRVDAWSKTDTVLASANLQCTQHLPQDTAMLSSHSSSGEEQMKVKGILKKSSKYDEVFCICRQPEDDQFMIECDACNEWFHGDCVDITSSEGKKIDLYYCSACRNINNTLEIRYFEKNNCAELYYIDENLPVPVRCVDCINCIIKPDCGECVRCKNKHGRCLEIVCLIETSTYYVDKKGSEKKHSNRDELSDDEDREAYSPLSSTTRRARGGGGVAVVFKTPRGRRKKEKVDESSPVEGLEFDKHNRPEYYRTLVERVDDAAETYAQWMYKSSQQTTKYAPKPGPVECLGRGCTREALAGSKYCSDECGMQVAKDRLVAYLPKGVDHYLRAQRVGLRQYEVRK